MKKLIINGRFLTQNITGVQRVAHEIVRELDKISKEKNLEIVILVPKNIIFDNLYENIKMKKVGILKGHLWEQIELPIYSFLEKGILLNLCNTAPIINTGIVDIHDISFKVNPQFFSKKMSLYYQILIWILIKTSKKLLTVSKFSRNQIVKYYNINLEKIEIVYNSWEHILNFKEDFNILKKINVESKNFYLGVSSIELNKNFKYIIELAKLYPQKKFVITGRKNEKIINNFGINEIDNFIWCGYVSNEELKALYMSCKGFIFPSFYEGFGLPPLEAMGCGCDEIYVSKTSCLPEIFENSVVYINPNKVEKILDKKVKINKEKIKEVLEKYSWKESSFKIIRILEKENLI